jgi:hypothetical protein
LTAGAAGFLLLIHGRERLNHEIARRCRLDPDQGGEMCFVRPCLPLGAGFSAAESDKP